MPHPFVLSGSVYPVLLHGMMMVERFISHVCLYGARGNVPGHDCGHSVHGGGGSAGPRATMLVIMLGPDPVLGRARAHAAASARSMMPFAMDDIVCVQELESCRIFRMGLTGYF